MFLPHQWLPLPPWRTHRRLELGFSVFAISSLILFQPPLRVFILFKVRLPRRRNKRLIVVCCDLDSVDVEEVLFVVQRMVASLILEFVGAVANSFYAITARPFILSLPFISRFL